MVKVPPQCTAVFLCCQYSTIEVIYRCSISLCINQGVKMTNLVIAISAWSQAVHFQWIVLAALAAVTLWALATVRLTDG
jgi:hypothetical protein